MVVGASFQALVLPVLNLAHQFLGCFHEGCFERARDGFSVKSAARNFQAHLHAEGGSAIVMAFNHYVSGVDRGQTLPVVNLLLQHAVPGMVDIETQELERGFHEMRA
jgi:hypothetical protein